MLRNIFYILGLLSQYSRGYEIEDFETDVPNELLYSAEEYGEESSPALDSYVKDSSSEEPPDDADSHETPEEIISFAGPVKAKGSITFGATFGNAPGPGSYPLFSTMIPVWFPPLFFPQYFFHTSPQPVSPMPLAFSHIPLTPIFLPASGNSQFSEKGVEETQKNKNKTKPTSKEIFLKVTPLVSVAEMPVAKDLENVAVDSLSPDEILASPVVFLDEDFTDYDEVEGFNEMSVNDDLKLNEPESSASGIVFGGFVPASGSVKIAAKF